MATARLTIEETCRFLSNAEDVLILAHRDPDGDTLGSSHALMYALRRLGKRAKVVCSDPIAPRYGYMLDPCPEVFEPKTVVASDVADLTLLGKTLEPFFDRVDLCIDHHPSNREYAKRLLLDPDAAATCEMMLEVVRGLGVTLDKQIADCLYTGIATDTGCFRFPNTSRKTHLAAAELIAAGADIEKVNRLMFETVSRARMAVQSEAIRTLEYYFQSRCAMITITRDSMERNHCTEDDLEGLSAVPRQIEGVEVGITLRENPDRKSYRVSMRTAGFVNASDVCTALGGGGHKRAAGCSLIGTLEEAKERILSVLGRPEFGMV